MTEDDAAPTRGRYWRAPRLWVVIGLVVPAFIGLAFGSAARRVIVPESLMLAAVVIVTLIGGVVPGLVAAVSSTLSLWYFNLAPGLSFNVRHDEDRIAVIVVGLVTVGLVVLVDRLRNRAHRVALLLADVEMEQQLQRRTLVTMQRALLPFAPPSVRGITVASCYQTGGDEAITVGGDWFAFVPVNEHCLGIALGDVDGHGLAAVTAMAQYRYSLRAIATQDPDPAEVMNRLQSVMANYRTDGFTSCVYGLLDTDSATWTFTNAGHPPPVIVRGATCDPMTERHGPVVGVTTDVHYESSVRTIEPGDLLVLYSDGLIERRTDDSIDVGIERLRDRLTRIRTDGPLADECASVAQDLVPPSATDDVAIVIARLEPHA
jgi:serine phosphatase RsbU (regulator of sigma subunit)